MFRKKTVSTKNLYVIRLVPIKQVIWYGMEQQVFYDDSSIFTLGYKKKIRNFLDDDEGETIYTDWLTKTVYKYCNYRSNRGDCVIIGATPLITEHKRIPISILIEELNALNKQALQTSENKPKVHIKH